MQARPFKIAIPDADILALQRRLRDTRLPVSVDEESWNEGTSVAFMHLLADRWLNRFDWRAQEARLNRLPQFLMDIDGLDIHFVHAKGTGPAPMPLILTHGWPGSFFEFERLIPLLTDPAAHGGDAGDAFDVVVPSLPGFGFSAAPTAAGTSSRRIAELWSKLMGSLGYERFAAQGGDLGAGVSTWLARRFPERVVGIHLNYIPGSYSPPLGPRFPAVTEAEQAFIDEADRWSRTEGAYAAIHGTKPQTLAFALSDSPLGLAAWISEKFRAWTDCDGDITRVVDLDELLTNISLYWFTNSPGSSLRMYKENRAEPLTFGRGEKITPPMGMASFPRELPTPPRSWVERVYDVRRWTVMPRGGHFAALEQPALLAEEIRAFFRPLR